MATNDHCNSWLIKASEELQIIAPSEWTICLYPYLYGDDVAPDPSPVFFVGDHNDNCPTAVNIAKMASYFHFTIISDLTVVDGNPVCHETTHNTTKRSIYARPVFRSDGYDPNPIMRPIIGTVCFFSSILIEEIINNDNLHAFTERFVGIATKELPELLKTSKVSWEVIREDILARLTPGPFKLEKALRQISDKNGSSWLEFSHGCFAREADVNLFADWQDRFFVANKADRWIDPDALSGVTELEANDIRRHIESGHISGLYKKIEEIQNPQTKAAKYYEISTICMERDDKFNSLIAANKYAEILEETPKAYEMVGRVYWWFEDTDTAIKYSEKALELALKLTEEERSKDASLIYRIKNNLAFYYAENRVNEEIAFAYVAETLANTRRDDGLLYLAFLDTAGYVYARLASNVKDLDEGIKYLLTVLEMEPQSKDTQEHLIEALERKKALGGTNISGERKK